MIGWKSELNALIDITIIRSKQDLSSFVFWLIRKVDWLRRVFWRVLRRKLRLFGSGRMQLLRRRVLIIFGMSRGLLRGQRLGWGRLQQRSDSLYRSCWIIFWYMVGYDLYEKLFDVKITRRYRQFVWHVVVIQGQVLQWRGQAQQPTTQYPAGTGIFFVYFAHLLSWIRAPCPTISSAQVWRVSGLRNYNVGFVRRHGK